MASLLNMSSSRVMGGKGLPYDAEIEYLESSGTQWIDTGIIPDSRTSFFLQVMLVNTANTIYFFETRPLSSSLKSSLGVLAFPSDFQYRYDSNLSSDSYLNFFPPTPIKDVLYTIETNRNEIYLNGEKKLTCRVVNFNCNLPLCLFAQRTDNGITAMSKFKLYAFKLFDADNILLIDLIPVRVGNVGYMYDKVSGTLFGNAGTGNFILGADKQ